MVICKKLDPEHLFRASSPLQAPPNLSDALEVSSSDKSTNTCLSCGGRSASISLPRRGNLCRVGGSSRMTRPPGQSLQSEWVCCVCLLNRMYHHTVGCLTADSKRCLVTVCLEAVTKLYQRYFSLLVLKVLQVGGHGTSVRSCVTPVHRVSGADLSEP